jgi:hypothetical protein
MSQAAKVSVNLSGNWKLNMTESVLGNQHPEPDYELTWKLEQLDNGIRIAESAKNVSVVNIPLPNSSRTTEYWSDGRKSEIVRPGFFPGMPATKIAAKAEWQGDTFWIEERSYPNSSYSITRRRIYLSEDGARLVELREMRSLTGDSAQRLVFERVQ